MILSLRKKGRCLATLQYFFPSYRVMKGRYPGMGKTPLLLPLMWVRREVDSVRCKRTDKGIRRASRHITIKDGDIRKREDALGEWGLIGQGEVTGRSVKWQSSCSGMIGTADSVAVISLPFLVD